MKFRVRTALLAALLCSFAVPTGFLRAETRQAKEPNYLEPNVLAGTIYDLKSKKVLFTFRRTATNTGPTIQVLREYILPSGKMAAREHVVYQSGNLSSYRVEDLQCGDHGGATVQSEAGESGEKKVAFEYLFHGAKKTGTEKYQREILITDMVVPFILENWEPLMSGSTVKCRLLALARAETVGFRLVKESESVVRGKKVVIVRMEASSLIVAQFIDPLYFTLEKEGEHRVLQYSGRITPSISRNNKWEDADAMTVFDWK
jgi:hypothetical protein